MQFFLYISTVSTILIFTISTYFYIKLHIFHMKTTYVQYLQNSQKQAIFTTELVIIGQKNIEFEKKYYFFLYVQSNIWEKMYNLSDIIFCLIFSHFEVLFWSYNVWYLCYLFSWSIIHRIDKVYQNCWFPSSWGTSKVIPGFFFYFLSLCMQ